MVERDGAGSCADSVVRGGTPPKARIQTLRLLQAQRDRDSNLSLWLDSPIVLNLPAPLKERKAILLEIAAQATLDCWA